MSMYYYRRRSNPLKWVVIIVILLIIIFLGYWFYKNYFSTLDFSQPEKEAEVSNDEVGKLAQVLAANLSLLDGQVEVDINNQGYKIASLNTVLHQSDKIKTSSDSRAVLKLENGSIIRLAANTELIFDSLLSDNIKLNQIEGRSYHNLQKTTSYKVETLQVSVFTSSTVFEVITNEADNYVAVLDLAAKLSVEVSDDQGVVNLVRLSQGEKALIDLTLADKNDLIKIEKFDLDNLKQEVWYQWNFELDSQVNEIIEEEQPVIEITEEKQPEEDDEPDFSVVTDSLVLATNLKDSGAFLSWSVYKEDNFKSYQVVRSSTDSNLKYPVAKSVKVSSSIGLNTYIDNDIEPGNRYYYRVCVLKQNDKVTCGNVAVLQIPNKPKDTIAPQNSIISISISDVGVSLSWTANSDNDFKEYQLVRSAINQFLTYPADGSIATITNKEQQAYLDKTVNINSLGRYYYRLCTLDTADNVACSNVKIIEDGQVK